MKVAEFLAAHCARNFSQIKASILLARNRASSRIYCHFEKAQKLSAYHVYIGRSPEITRHDIDTPQGSWGPRRACWPRETPWRNHAHRATHLLLSNPRARRSRHDPGHQSCRSISGPEGACRSRARRYVGGPERLLSPVRQETSPLSIAQIHPYPCTRLRPQLCNSLAGPCRQFTGRGDWPVRTQD
jgi:hypothetical protein